MLTCLFLTSGRITGMGNKGGRPPEHVIVKGQRFGRLTVVDPTLRRPPTKSVPYGTRAALCRCDCGTMTTPVIYSLVSGNSRSCGCLQRELAARNGEKNFAPYARSQENRDRLKALWVSDSPAGLRMREHLAELQQDPVRKEAQRRAAQANTKHGLSHTHREYHTHVSMMYRCYNPKAQSYPNYGGRGIKVHESWHDVRAFVGWLDENLGPRPAGMSLERIDNDGDYEPGNVRWATKREQISNRRSVRQLQAQIDALKRELDGKEVTN